MFVSRRICTFRRPCNLAKSALPGAQSKARSQQGAESGQQWLNLSRQISWNRSIMFARLPSQATFKRFRSIKIISKVPQSLENTVKRNRKLQNRNGVSEESGVSIIVYLCLISIYKHEFCWERLSCAHSCWGLWSCARSFCFPSEHTTQDVSVTGSASRERTEYFPIEWDLIGLIGWIHINELSCVAIVNAKDAAMTSEPPLTLLL